MINIKHFDPNNIKIDEKSYKHILTHYIGYMECDFHIFSKYLVFQMKSLLFQSKYLVFRSKTLDCDQNTRYFESEILKY